MGLCGTLKEAKACARQSRRERSALHKAELEQRFGDRGALGCWGQAAGRMRNMEDAVPKAIKEKMSFEKSGSYLVGISRPL